MASGASDDDILKRYLLGTLAPESQKSVEERLFSDNRIFWEHLCLVEDDLVNDYARGRLDDHEKTDFERNFLCTDDRRGKLELAQALQAFVERQPANRQSAWEWLRGPAVAPRRAVAAAAVLLPLMAAGLVWQLTSIGSRLGNRRPKRGRSWNWRQRPTRGWSRNWLQPKRCWRSNWLTPNLCPARSCQPSRRPPEASSASRFLRDFSEVQVGNLRGCAFLLVPNWFGSSSIQPARSIPATG
jgi:hypothetical protein